MASSMISKYNAASSTAPAAFTAVASLPSSILPSGLYRITCYAGYVGTVGAAEQASGGNVSLYIGAATTPLGLPAVASVLYGPFTVDAQLDGTTTVSVGTAGSAGSSGVVYNCIVIASEQVGNQAVFNV